MIDPGNRVNPRSAPLTWHPAALRMRVHESGQHGKGKALSSVGALGVIGVGVYTIPGRVCIYLGKRIRYGVLIVDTLEAANYFFEWVSPTNDENAPIGPLGPFPGFSCFAYRQGWGDSPNTVGGI